MAKPVNNMHINVGTPHMFPNRFSQPNTTFVLLLLMVLLLLLVFVLTLVLLSLTVSLPLSWSLLLLSVFVFSSFNFWSNAYSFLISSVTGGRIDLYNTVPIVPTDVVSVAAAAAAAAIVVVLF